MEDDYEIDIDEIDEMITNGNDFEFYYNIPRISYLKE